MAAKQTGVQYCEGCGAKLPKKLKTCPYCGIEKPYLHRSKITNNKKFLAEKQFNASLAYTHASDNSAGTKVTSSMPVTKSNFGVRNNARTESVSGTSGKSRQYLRNRNGILVQACLSCKTRTFHVAYELVVPLSDRTWESSVVLIVSALRLPQQYSTTGDFLPFENAIVEGVKEIASVSFREKRFVQAVVGQSAIHSAMVFVINILGSDVVRQSDTANGSCSVSLSRDPGKHLWRLMSYTRILQSIYDVNPRVNLSLTILLLASLATKLVKAAGSKSSITRYKALAISHGEKCKNRNYKDKLLSAEDRLFLNFKMYPNEISEEFPLNKLRLRRIAYSLR
jgi:hypothetical protein